MANYDPQHQHLGFQQGQGFGFPQQSLGSQPNFGFQQQTVPTDNFLSSANELIQSLGWWSMMNAGTPLQSSQGMIPFQQQQKFNNFNPNAQRSYRGSQVRSQRGNRGHTNARGGHEPIRQLGHLGVEKNRTPNPNKSRKWKNSQIQVPRSQATYC